MLKVFLVEDEFVVREGIKKNIDWASHGYEFCGEASDGELAYPMIQKLRPDIVITDIKMPFMDGLELSKMIKQEFPWMEIIILSGYERFDYAKEGIKIGVAEYLTKPISGEDLLRVVDSLAEKIRKQQQELADREKYNLDMQEKTQQERRNLFQYLVTGDRPRAELMDLARSLDIDLMSMWYNIILLKVQSMKHDQKEYSNSIVSIGEKLDLLEDGEKVIYFDRNLEGKALLFKADSAEELEKNQNDFILRATEIMDSYEQIFYFGGIGMPVNRLSELPSSFEMASHAFAHRYLEKRNRFVTTEQINASALVEEGAAFDLADVNTKQLDRGKIKNFLRLGEYEEVVYFVDEFYKNLDQQAIRSNLFRQYVLMDIYFATAEFVEEIGFDKSEIESLDIAAGTMSSVEKAQEYTARILSQALELREKTASNRYGDIVDEVIRYIDENYADEELSLNLLASHVNFSPNHLSTVFSQQTGNTFIKYLTDYRMNKAKELLRCTSKKSGEISMEVGYKDSHYFSYLFKKTQGMTPTQYRGGSHSDAE